MNSKYALIMAFLLTTGSTFPMIIELKEAKKTLETTVKNGINDAIKELRNAFQLIQEQVVKGTAAPILNLQKKIKGLQGTLKDLRSLPSSALRLADIKDLPEVLDFLIGLMNEFETSLTLLRDDFSRASQDLNPTTDPLHIYKDFKDALKNFNEATTALQELIDVLKSA